MGQTIQIVRFQIFFEFILSMQIIKTFINLLKFSYLYFQQAMGKNSMPLNEKKLASQKKHPTTFQRIVWVANVIISVVICYFVLLSICAKRYPLIILLHTNEFKQALFAFIIFNALAILLHSSIAQWLEVFSGLGDTDIYRVHKNAINNTILWSTIFLGLYLNNRQTVRKSGYELQILDLFLFGRVVFSFGYTFGTAIGHQSFRSVGFGFTFCSIVMLMSIIVGFPFVEYFK